MRRLLYWSFATFFRLYAKLFLILVIKKGTRPEGRRIFVANHPNVFDPMYLLSHLGGRVTVLITEHAFHVPVFGSLLRYTKQIPVTDDHGNDAYKEALKRLRKGESILLFPEGDCDEGKKVLPFHTGAIRLALATHTPIVPVGIYLDPVKLWKRKTKIGNTHLIFTWYRYGWYGITFGDPVSVKGDINDRSFVKLKTKQLHATVSVLAETSKHMCLSAMHKGKRKVKRQFHSVLRFAYRIVCFMVFTRLH